MSTAIRTAMLLAAGFGKRMRPLSASCPKPLLPVAGTPLIDWTMARLRRHGVGHFVVNSHYLADHIAAHFHDVPDVILSHEATILDTGGGVRRALPLLAAQAFFVANADTIWQDGPVPAPTRLAHIWNPARMDALLLLTPTDRVADLPSDPEGMQGDYFLHGDGRAQRRTAGQQAPFLFAGLQILSATLFRDAPEGAFSLNRLYDRAEAQGRLFGLAHDAAWYHLGTPEALAQADNLLTGTAP